MYGAYILSFNLLLSKIKNNVKKPYTTDTHFYYVN